MEIKQNNGNEKKKVEESLRNRIWAKWQQHWTTEFDQKNLQQALREGQHNLSRRKNKRKGEAKGRKKNGRTKSEDKNGAKFEIKFSYKKKKMMSNKKKSDFEWKVFKTWRRTRKENWRRCWRYTVDDDDESIEKEEDEEGARQKKTQEYNKEE